MYDEYFVHAHWGGGAQQSDEHVKQVRSGMY